MFWHAPTHIRFQPDVESERMPLMSTHSASGIENVKTLSDMRTGAFAARGRRRCDEACESLCAISSVSDC